MKLALHYTYGQDNGVPSGPLYKCHAIDGNTIKIKFDYVGDGLKINNSSTIQGFVVSGADGQFYEADATITGVDEVTVTSSSVDNPINVRYLYTPWPGIITLYNSADLPASAFITDIIFNTKL